MKTLKEEIFELRAEGKAYNEIAEILGCSKATISYHCNEKVREYSRVKRNINKKKFMKNLKEENGGKCCLCHYDKCLSALEFHHIDKKTKTSLRKNNGILMTVSSLAYCKSRKAAREEAKKCILICANCHREIEENERNVGNAGLEPRDNPRKWSGRSTN